MNNNYFRDYLTKTGDATLIKMDHYLDVYPEIVGHLQGKTVSFLEIGVYKGGSLGLWKGYFGDRSKLVFLDIDPACKALEIDGTIVEIGDQEDRAFLERIGREYGPFDLIVDDGGHKMSQQRTSFQVLFQFLKPRGLYVVEDTHTSYWPGFGGGFRAKNSFIEVMKDLIDRMHSWYTDQDDIFPLHVAAKIVRSVRFYDSMVVVERKDSPEPPVSIASRNGQTSRSRKILEARNRKSIF